MNTVSAFSRHCFVPSKKQNRNMYMVSDIKSIKERSLTYYPRGMSEISRGLREAIPPEPETGSPFFIPEGCVSRSGS